VNRLTCWRINVKGEPPPTFLWKKEGKEITSDEKYQVEFFFRFIVIYK